MNIDQKDFAESKAFIQEIIGNHGQEQLIAMLLMSLFNAFRHLADECNEKRFNEIQKDPVMGLSSGYAYKFREIGNKICRKYGISEESNLK